MDDTLEELWMAVACLGWDECPAHPVQSSGFFRRLPLNDSFAMPAFKDFIMEFSNALKWPRDVPRPLAP